MKKLKCCTIIGIIFVLVLGTIFHFLYEWTENNFVVGLFAPINESVWEHMKLVFFPMLLYTLAMTIKFKKIYPCITSSFCLGILSGTSLIPVFFYAYTCIIGKDVFILDLATFALSVIIAFLTAYKFTLSCKLLPFSPFIYGFVCLYLICFILFTLKAPDAALFADPAVSNTKAAQTVCSS